MEKHSFDQKAIHNSSKTRLKAWFHPKHLGPDLSPYSFICAHPRFFYISQHNYTCRKSKQGWRGRCLHLWTLADDQLSLSYYELYFFLRQHNNKQIQWTDIWWYFMKVWHFKKDLSRIFHLLWTFTFLESKNSLSRIFHFL